MNTDDPTLLDALPPANTPAQVAFRRELALAVLSLPREARAGAYCRGVAGYRAALDKAFPEAAADLKRQSTENFAHAFCDEILALAVNLADSGDMGRA